MSVKLSGAFAEPMPKELGVVRKVSVNVPYGAVVRTTPSKGGAVVATITDNDSIVFYPNHRQHDYVGVAVEGRFGYVSIHDMTIEGYDNDRGIFREPAAPKPVKQAKRKAK